MEENYKHVLLSTDASIRVLELLPGTLGDPLAANLREVNLDDGPVFNALSYCWGEPIFDKLLQCNGQAFRITESVADALQHLRDSKHLLCIWIDQICINQQDILERNHQVQLMARIYSSAAIVFIWVGLETESSAFMFQCMRESDVPPGEGPRLVDARTEFLERPWFERVWTSQEAVLAKHDPLLCCGMTRLSWSKFAEFEETLASLQLDKTRVPGLWTGFSYEFGGGKDLDRQEFEVYQLSGDQERDNAALQREITAWMKFLAINTAREKGSLGRFAWQMFMTHTKKSTDDKDKVYAISGMSSFEGDPIITDYKKTVVSVFTEAMAKIIEEDFPIALLFYYLQSSRLARRRDILRLPSWVVDFTGLSHLPHDVSPWEAGVNSRFDPHEHYHIIWYAIEMSKRSSTPVAKVSFRDLSFHVSGVNMGVVDDTLPAVPDEDAEWYDWYDWLPKILPLVRDRNITPAEILLSADSAHCGRSEDWGEMLSTFERLFTNPISHGERALDTDSDDSNDSNYRQFEKGCRAIRDLMSEMVIWPNFFVTNTGRIGRCNSPVQRGDIIAGLFEIDIPFVLRKNPDDDTYRMVDWAHVAAHCYRHVTIENSDGNANVIDISAYPRTQFVIV